MGVHMAAALPENPWIEYSFHDYDALVEQTVQFEGGYAIAPERPGHGLALSEAAREDYARAEVD
jgi:L-alanine-DL-glutamate epimerase-like enolase superfamily enzyme